MLLALERPGDGRRIHLLELEQARAFAAKVRARALVVAQANAVQLALLDVDCYRQARRWMGHQVALGVAAVLPERWIERLVAHHDLEKRSFMESDDVSGSVLLVVVLERPGRGWLVRSIGGRRQGQKRREESRAQVHVHSPASSLLLQRQAHTAHGLCPRI